MQRILTTTKLSEKTSRVRVKIESDDCEADSQFAEEVKQMLIRNFGDNPSLLACGTAPFQTLKLFHNGMKWIVEAEATVENSNAQQPNPKST